jgi:hypothetical protein
MVVMCALSFARAARTAVGKRDGELARTALWSILPADAAMATAGCG